MSEKTGSYEMKLADSQKYCEEIAANAWRKIAGSKFAMKKKIGAVPRILFRDLPSDTNGLAFPDGHIEISQNVLNALEELDDTGTEFLREVTLHEVAHVAELRILDEMGHGEYWKAIYQFIGGDGKICNDPLDKSQNFADLHLIFGVLEAMAIGAFLAAKTWGDSACIIWLGIVAGVIFWVFQLAFLTRNEPSVYRIAKKEWPIGAMILVAIFLFP